MLLREPENQLEMRFPLAQGVTAACLFQLRPNNVAVAFLYVLFCIYSSYRTRASHRLLMRLGGFFASFLTVNALILCQLIRHGALREYFSLVFGFGMHYSLHISFIRHFYALVVGFLELAPFGASLITCAALIEVVRSDHSWEMARGRYAILGCSLFASELLFASISGMAFEHYFLMWLFPVGLLGGYFISRCRMLVVYDKRHTLRAAFAGICVMLICASLLESLRAIGKSQYQFSDGNENAVLFVHEHSSPSDRVFVWGDYGSLHFRLGLKPASRYFSTVPMAHDSEAYRELALDALRDVEHSKAKFVLEVPVVNFPALFARQPTSRYSSPNGSWDDNELLQAKDCLSKRYSLILSDASSGIKVYGLDSADSSYPQTCF